MKKSVKTPLIITICVALSLNSIGQLKLPGSSAFGNDVRKVIEDYPNRFINLMGEVVAQHTQSTDYNCSLSISGAEEALVTRYSSRKEVCSWQATMLTTEDFNKAKQKFRSIYNQLQNLTVQPGAGTNMKLKGEYQAPTEERKFTSILFSLDKAEPATGKLKIELSLEFFAPMEWKVRLMVYDRDREDNERGEIRD